MILGFRVLEQNHPHHATAFESQSRHVVDARTEAVQDTSSFTSGY